MRIERLELRLLRLLRLPLVPAFEPSFGRVDAPTIVLSPSTARGLTIVPDGVDRATRRRLARSARAA